MFVYYFVSPGLRIEIIFRKERTGENRGLILKKLSRKSRWKNGIICLVSMLPSRVIVLNLFKKVHFLQFCADLSQKPKSVKAIYIYGSENFHWSLSENNMVYRGLSHRLIKISKTMLTRQKFNKALRFQTLISSKHEVIA